MEVAGTNFEAGPPEIRWNAVDGTLLGKAQSPEFKLTVTVPDDEEGLYSLVAVSRGAQGQVTGVARTSFAVTGTAPRTGAAAAPAPAPAPPAPESGSGTSPLPAMALGAALTGAGVVGGAALTRRRGSAGSPG